MFLYRYQRLPRIFAKDWIREKCSGRPWEPLSVNCGVTDTWGVASDENERRRFPFTASHRRAVLLPPCRAFHIVRNARRAESTAGPKCNQTPSGLYRMTVDRAKRTKHVQRPMNTGGITTEQRRGKITLYDAIRSESFSRIDFFRKGSFPGTHDKICDFVLFKHAFYSHKRIDPVHSWNTAQSLL